MKKLSKEQRRDIITMCILDNTKENIQKVASDYDITPRYIYKLLKSDNREEIETDIQNNKSMFIKKADNLIDVILDRMLDKVYDDKTTLQQLSTTLGILYDKTRLENNLSTSNNSININIKVEK